MKIKKNVKDYIKAAKREPLIPIQLRIEKSLLDKVDKKLKIDKMKRVDLIRALFHYYVEN